MRENSKHVQVGLGALVLLAVGSLVFACSSGKESTESDDAPKSSSFERAAEQSGDKIEDAPEREPEQLERAVEDGERKIKKELGEETESPAARRDAGTPTESDAGEPGNSDENTSGESVDGSILL